MPDIRQWRQTWRHLGAPPDDALYHDLVARYSEPHRKYHTTQHLDECFAKLAELADEALHPGEVELGVWFHDAVYDTRRADNEARSAQWARESALAACVHAEAAERIHALVLATRHDAVPREPDEKVLVDVDLAILGADAVRFGEYERQVREEYSWVPAAVFRAKRRAILKALLERPTIFNTGRFVAAYEAPARRNLERALRQLGETGSQ